MRTPNDFKLAKNATGIDILLGGHDHVCEDHVVSSLYLKNKKQKKKSNSSSYSTIALIFLLLG